MRTQIRLADRMGLLTGPHLSRLQASAAYYREIDEQVEQRERDQQQFKYALLQSHHLPFNVLFPELMPQSEEGEEEEAEDFETPGEGETIIYKFAEQPNLTPEEMEAELALLTAGLQGSVSIPGGELYG